MTLAQSPSAGWRNNRVRRIPGAMLAVERPAPVRLERQQHPCRTAKRAGEMRDRRVDANHQIGKRQHRSGIGEVGELVAEMHDAGSRAQHLGIGGTQLALDADKAHTRPATATAASCASESERLRSLTWRGAAGPGQRDARRRQRFQARPPFRDLRSATRADREFPPECWTESVLQASGRLVSGQCTSNGGSGSPRATIVGDAFEPGQQALQLRLHLQHDAGAGARKQRRVAREHHRIAEPLLGVQQDGLAGERGFAEPERLAQILPRAPCRRASSATRIRRGRADSRRSSTATAPR